MPSSTRIGPGLTLMQLFEEIALIGPMPDEYPAEVIEYNKPPEGDGIPAGTYQRVVKLRDGPARLAEAQHPAREYGARAWAGLLQGASELIRRLPPEEVAKELGPYEHIPATTALAWAISHWSDPIYLKARPDIGAEPFDAFTRQLGLLFERTLALGRSGYIKVSCLDGVDLKSAPEFWFSQGAMRFDPLRNAIEVSGWQFSGVEAWFEERPAGEVEVDDDAGANDSDDDEREPTEVETWMRFAEAKALTQKGQPRLKMVETVKACIAAFAAGDATVTREVAERAFKRAVWPDRRLGRGRRW